MTANQFKKLRVNLFGSQPKAANALGVTQQAVSHWELGARPIPQTIINLLKCLEGREKQ